MLFIKQLAIGCFAIGILLGFAALFLYIFAYVTKLILIAAILFCAWYLGKTILSKHTPKTDLIRRNENDI
jgi:hypothetical protein